jgi:hypothetical protein
LQKPWTLLEDSIGAEIVLMGTVMECQARVQLDKPRAAEVNAALRVLKTLRLADYVKVRHAGENRHPGSFLFKHKEPGFPFPRE